MYTILTLCLPLLLFHGCASGDSIRTLQPISEKLLGKSRAEVLRCAGQPIKEATHGQNVILRYYQEASMFEESRPFLKGSQPGLHHGCWANLLIEEDHVTGVEFVIVPEESQEHEDECVGIFSQCPQ